MNDKRRTKIRRAISYLEIASSIAQRALDEEQDAMDNFPENLQASYAYESMEEAVSYIEDAIDGMNEVSGNLEASIA